MDNPLTQEEIDELNRIIKLPHGEQETQLRSFFTVLSQDKREYILNAQTQHCLFCGIVLGTVQSYKLYEDNELVAVLDINPANLGHVLAIPKIHVKNSYEISPKIFETANLISKRMKEKLNADSNIFVANGENAGQKFDHTIINIIPRYKDDKVGLIWHSKKINQDQLKELASILKIEEEKKEIKKEKIVIKEGKKKERIP